MANAEAEWRQLLQLIQQDRKQRVWPLYIFHVSICCALDTPICQGIEALKILQMVIQHTFALPAQVSESVHTYAANAVKDAMDPLVLLWLAAHSHFSCMILSPWLPMPMKSPKT